MLKILTFYILIGSAQIGAACLMQIAGLGRELVVCNVALFSCEDLRHCWLGCNTELGLLVASMVVRQSRTDGETPKCISRVDLLSKIVYQLNVEPSTPMLARL